MGIANTTSIYKSNGQLVKITSVKQGDMLLGLSNGQLVESAVMSKTIQPPRSDWLKASGPRIGYKKGGSTFALTASPDQLIGMNKIPLSKYTLGDDTEAIFNSLDLTKVQRSILLGILLGDGSLQKLPSISGTHSLRWVHSSKQIDYLEWTIQALGGLAKRGSDGKSGYGSVIHQASTLFHPDISNVFSGFNKPNGTIPNWVVQQLDPIAIAFWYMDDGSLVHASGQRDRAHFSTYSFSKESHEVLVAALAKFGMDPTIQPSLKGPSIRLNSVDADLLFCLIAPYIPPSMQYKLPSYYRGNQGWIPKSKFEFKKIVVNGVIDNISPRILSATTSGREYVLETETGNYFAHGLLLSH